MLLPAPFKMFLQFAEMVMRKYSQGGAAQFCAIYERSVAEFIEQDDIVLADQSRHRPEGGGVSAAEGKRSFCLFPLRQGVFQAQMWRLRPANQPRSSSTDPKFSDRANCCLAQSRIAREPEIIVGGKIDQSVLADLDFRSLRTADFAQLALQRTR